MNLAAFDIEIAKEIPEGCDWREIAPLGISCAALAYPDPLGIGHRYMVWEGWPQMDEEQIGKMLADLEWVGGRGVQIVTWNGLGFDFPVIGYEIERPTTISMLARSHIDMMFMVVARNGHYLGLEKAARGMGLGGKRKEVKLRDGSSIHDMSGAKAPQLWADRETDAVIEYLKDDVSQTLELAYAVQEKKAIHWVSNTLKERTIDFPEGLMTVEECLELPLADTSWMSDPPSREQFTDWMKVKE
jgi:hypothetical protein